MEDAALAVASRVSAARKGLALRDSEIIRSYDISISQKGIAERLSSTLKLQLPKSRRRLFRATQFCINLPRKPPGKDYFQACSIISRNVLPKHDFALGLNCRGAWRAVVFFCSQERDTGSLASAAVAVAAVLTVGFSLSLPLPATADTAGDTGSLVDSGYVVEGIDAQLGPEQTLALKAELRSLHQSDLSPEQAPSINDQGKESLAGTLPNTDGLAVMEHESGLATLSSGITAPLNGAFEVPYRSEDRNPPAAETLGVIIPASCPPSHVVAAAAVGSMASAASVAGNALTESSVLLQSSSAFNGAQILARVLQHLGGGGVAGAVGASVVYPLDTIKTRMQAQSSKDGEVPQYKDEFDCFKRLLVDEGPGSLYNGLLPQLLGIAPEKALKLTVNEVLLQMLEQLLPGARVWLLEFVAGGGGGFSQVLVTNPMEIVKLRLQMKSKIASSKGLWQVVKELGLQGLYCGSGLTLARDVPGSGIFFACYALFNQLYPEQNFWAGFLAAIPATILVTPFDVIKTRLQMETPAGEEPYRNAWHCFKVLWQQEGPKGLFKGGLVRVLRTSPQFGITLMIYSSFCKGR